MILEKKTFLIENIIFFICAFLNLIPVFSHKFFVTLDGPSHLYNVKVLSEIIINRNEILSIFYQINPVVVPNWLGHALLLFFNFFLTPPDSEKLLIALIVFCLPVSFRYFVNSLNKKSLLYFLIFPFTYSQFQLVGFYNMCIAIVLYFFVSGFVINNFDKSNIKFYLSLAFLFLLIFLTHGLIYAITLLTVMLIFVSLSIQKIYYSKIKQSPVDFIKPAFKVLISALPSLILFVFYWIRIKVPSSNDEFTNDILLQYVFNIRSIATYWGTFNWAIILYGVFFSLTIIILAGSLKHILNSARKISIFLMPSNVFFILCLVSLILLFTIPNGYNAGAMSDRLVMLFYMFLIAWIAISKVSLEIQILSCMLVLLTCYNLNSNLIELQKLKSQQASEVFETSKFIAANKIVSSINLFDTWDNGHISNYAGIDKPMVILENYEAEIDWFPLRWNSQPTPLIKIGNTEMVGYNLNKTHSAKLPALTVDYILLIGNQPEKSVVYNYWKSEIDSNYHIIHSSQTGFANLYQINY